MLLFLTCVHLVLWHLCCSSFSAACASTGWKNISDFCHLEVDGIKDTPQVSYPFCYISNFQKFLSNWRHNVETSHEINTPTGSKPTSLQGCLLFELSCEECHLSDQNHHPSDEARPMNFCECEMILKWSHVASTETDCWIFDGKVEVEEIWKMGI